MNGPLSLIKSRKFWLALAGATTGVIGFKANPTIAVTAVMGFLGLLIGGIAVEDAAEKVGKSLATRDANELSNAIRSLSSKQ